LFGAALAGAAAVALVPALPDPEKLKWIPGAKAYFGIQKPQHLQFHNDVFTFSSEELSIDDFSKRFIDPAIKRLADRIDADCARVYGVPAAVMKDQQSGLSMRMVRDYHMSVDRFPARVDVLYGFACVRPELAVKVSA
jgi:hypothetical protein